MLAGNPKIHCISAVVCLFPGRKPQINCSSIPSQMKWDPRSPGPFPFSSRSSRGVLSLGGVPRHPDRTPASNAISSTIWMHRLTSFPNPVCEPRLNALAQFHSCGNAHSSTLYPGLIYSVSLLLNRQDNASPPLTPFQCVYTSLIPGKYSRSNLYPGFEYVERQLPTGSRVESVTYEYNYIQCMKVLICAAVTGLFGQIMSLLIEKPVNGC